MISIILPSVRPENLKNCIEAIIKAADYDDKLFEIILVTDFKHQWESANIKSFYAPERKGVVDALNKGIAVAQGDYLFTLSDEAILGDKAFLYLLKDSKELYQDKALLTPLHIPHYPFFYYGRYFAAFPFAHRDLIERVGGFFDPIYHCFYADPDLSLRCHQIDIEVHVCELATIYHPNNMSCEAHRMNVALYVEADRAIFKKRWKHLGEFKDP